jgi:nitrogen fixation NifU-like protein
MTLKLKGKSRTDAAELTGAFHDLVTTEVADPPRSLGDLRVMSGVRKFPQRVKCAILPWRAFEQALKGNADASHITTEEDEPVR